MQEYDDGVMYNIVRFYEDGRNRRVVARVYGIKAAKKWCNDPETSSYTAKSPRGCNGKEEKIEQWHKEKRHWFDGFERA